MHALPLHAKTKARTRALPQDLEVNFELFHCNKETDKREVAHSQQDLYLRKQHPADFQSITITAPSSTCLFIGNREHGPEMLDLLLFFFSAYFDFLSQVNGQVPLLAA